MISLAHRTVFIHIPKCGGISVETAFLADLGLDWHRHRILMLCLKKPDPRYPGAHPRLAHLRAAEYRRHYLPAEVFDSFYRFALVRNPFSRVESFYYYGKWDAKTGFDTFVLKHLPRLRAKNPFYASQLAFLTDEDGTPLVEEVFRLEEIGPAWERIRQRAGVGAELPHRNRSEQRAPLTWTAEMREVTQAAYGPEFAALGYDPDPDRRRTYSDSAPLNVRSIR